MYFFKKEGRNGLLFALARLGVGIYLFQRSRNVRMNIIFFPGILKYGANFI